MNESVLEVGSYVGGYYIKRNQRRFELEQYAHWGTKDFMRTQGRAPACAMEIFFHCDKGFVPCGS